MTTFQVRLFCERKMKTEITVFAFAEALANSENSYDSVGFYRALKSAMKRSPGRMLINAVINVIDDPINL